MSVGNKKTKDASKQESLDDSHPMQDTSSRFMSDIELRKLGYTIWSRQSNAPARWATHASWSEGISWTEEEILEKIVAAASKES